MATNDELIWKYFKSKGLSDCGVAGLMGNIQAESGLNPQNLQNSYEKKLGFTDATYTAAVDNGTYTKDQFVNDKAGYGLVQWTYWSLKKAMYEYIHEQKKKSIGSLDAQMEFLAYQLEHSYPAIWATLKNATTVLQASNEVLLKFERPADQSAAVQQKRASYGQAWYDKYKGSVNVTTTQTATKPVQQTTGGYTNSPLVCYTKISPNKTSPRNHVIDTITIHCMAGNLTIENCGNVFAPSARQASSNYGIGSDGRIAMYVEEKDRSWCSSNSANDNRAITIEVANDGGAPDWHVSDKAMAALIQLCADICKRNNIKQLIWSTDKNTRINHLNGANMTVHRDYAAKACPGDYLYNKHGYIAAEVNKLLGAPTTSTPIVSKPTTTNPTTPTVSANGFKNGDIIKLVPNATYWNGKAIPAFVLNSTLYYRGTNEHGIIFSTQKTGAITGVVKPNMIQGAQTATTNPAGSFMVKVTADNLNIRAGAGTNFQVVGAIKDKGTYTIVQVSGNWGKLKSGAGWICLDYTKRV